MRERPKQPSYLERHRMAEEIQTKNHSAFEDSKTGGFPAFTACLRLTPSAIPKKNDKGGAITVSRVRSGASRVTEKSAALQNSACPGKMTKFKNFDDIPDGLPVSPQHIRDSGDVVVDKENYGDDDEGRDYRHHDVLPMKQPTLPSEVDKYFRDGCHYEQSYSRPSSNQLSKYPPLQADCGVTSQPVVYSSNCIKSVHEFHRDIRADDNNDDDDENDWYNCSDDDSETYNQTSHQRMSNYDTIETSNLSSKNGKVKREQNPPPDLPYESCQDGRRGSTDKDQDKIDVKEQLYFSRQPRQIDYT